MAQRLKIVDVRLDNFVRDYFKVSLNFEKECQLI
jgi:hypothetical protein